MGYKFLDPVRYKPRPWTGSHQREMGGFQNSGQICPLPYTITTKFRFTLGADKFVRSPQRAESESSLPELNACLLRRVGKLRLWSDAQQRIHP
jgi:hypothetical protein